MGKAAEASYEDVAKCPMQFLARARQETPVVKLTSDNPDNNGYLVTRHSDVTKVCRDTETYSSVGNPQSDGWGVRCPAAASIYREKGWPLRRVLVWVDPPEHGRFRKYAEKIFSAGRIAARAEHINLCIDKLMARIADGGEIEGVADFAFQLPAMVMTREFGASEDDYMYLMNTSEIIGRTIEFTQNYGLEPDEIEIQAAQAATDFQQFMAPRIEAVRNNPTNTMLSDLVNARDGEEAALAVDEIQSILIVFVLAALHSTAVMLSWALKCLAEHQDVQARLRREPEKIDAFVEEVLRLNGAVATSFRTTTRDAEIDGVDLPLGSQVYVRWDSANHDESKWEDPEAFNIDRKGIRGHMAFGSGIHFCVGNPLARKEMSETVKAFLERFSRIELAGDPVRLDSFGLNALTSLPLRLGV